MAAPLTYFVFPTEYNANDLLYDPNDDLKYKLSDAPTVFIDDDSPYEQTADGADPTTTSMDLDEREEEDDDEEEEEEDQPTMPSNGKKRKAPGTGTKRRDGGKTQVRMKPRDTDGSMVDRWGNDITLNALPEAYDAIKYKTLYGNEHLFAQNPDEMGTSADMALYMLKLSLGALYESVSTNVLGITFEYKTEAWVYKLTTQNADQLNWKEAPKVMLALSVKTIWELSKESVHLSMVYAALAVKGYLGWMKTAENTNEKAINAYLNGPSVALKITKEDLKAKRTPFLPGVIADPTRALSYDINTISEWTNEMKKRFNSSQTDAVTCMVLERVSNKRVTKFDIKNAGHIIIPYDKVKRNSERDVKTLLLIALTKWYSRHCTRDSAVYVQQNAGIMHYIAAGGRVDLLFNQPFLKTYFT